MYPTHRRMQGFYPIIWGVATLTVLSCGPRKAPSFQKLTGPYFGQEPPGATAKLFAPAIVSTRFNEDGGPVFTPDGNDVFWRIGGAPFSVIVTMKQRNGHWSKPEVAPFSGQYQDGGLSMTPDGRRIYFVSKRPVTGLEPLSRFNVWMTEKTPEGWTDPTIMGPPINDPEDYYTRLTIAADGTLIKQSQRSGGKGGWDLYLCRFENGGYSDPIPLKGVNSPYNEYAPELAPDGSYLLFQSDNRPDSTGGIDLYVSFREEDGSWSPGINLGEAVNTPHTEKWPSISPDGKYLFFTSDRPVDIRYAQYAKARKRLEEIQALYDFYHAPAHQPCGGDLYWIDAAIIRQIKDKPLPKR